MSKNGFLEIGRGTGCFYCYVLCIFNNFHQIYRKGAKMVKPKPLDQTRNSIRVRHISFRTELAYVDWIIKFILFHNKRHPGDIAFRQPPRARAHLRMRVG